MKKKMRASTRIKLTWLDMKSASHFSMNCLPTNRSDTWMTTVAKFPSCNGIFKKRRKLGWWFIQVQRLMERPLEAIIRMQISCLKLYAPQLGRISLQDAKNSVIRQQGAKTRETACNETTIQTVSKTKTWPLKRSMKMKQNLLEWKKELKLRRSYLVWLLFLFLIACVLAFSKYITKKRGKIRSKYR